MSGIEAKISESVIRWCRKYSVLFRTIFEDEELRNFFRGYSAYSRPKGHLGLHKILDDCFHEAYDSGVVIPDYLEVIEDGKLSRTACSKPTKEWVATLTKKQILGVIAFHFRNDHFSEGSWISKSVAEGYMMVLVDGLME